MARFHFDRAAMFDLGRTGELATLFAMPREARDPAWFARFYDAAWFGSIELASSDSFFGLDGMPYIRLNLPRDGVPFDSQCLANVAEQCLDRGVGAVLFASPDDPPEAAQFVFSFGLIDSLVRYDSPEGDPADVDDWALPAPLPPKRGLFGLGRARAASMQVLTATPSADYLPPYAARALSHYLNVRWELPDPHVQLMISADLRPTRNLIIGRKGSTFPNPQYAQDLMSYTAWYLPPRRGLGLMPEDWSLSEMTPLRELC